MKRDTEKSAAEPSPSPELRVERLSLERALEVATARHPRIEAAHAGIEVAQGLERQAALWPNPQIDVEIEEGSPSRGGLGGDNRMIGRFNVQLPVSGRLGAQIQVARAQKQQARFSKEQTLWFVRARVRWAFWRLVLANRGIEIAETNLEIARTLTERARDRVATGAAPQTELLRAEIERGRAQLVLERARAQKQIAHAQLTRALGLTKLEIGELVGALPERFAHLESDRLLDRALSRSPQLALARATVERARARLLLAQRSYLPEPNLGVAFGRVRESGNNRKVLEWSLNVPVPLFNRNQGTIEARRASIRAANARYRSVSQNLVAELRSALQRYQQLREQIEAYRQTILPRARASLRLIEDGYRQGKLDQIDVLDAQRTVATARVAYLQRLQLLLDAALQIERLSGVSVFDWTERNETESNQ